MKLAAQAGAVLTVVIFAVTGWVTPTSATETNRDTRELGRLIKTYTLSIDRADTALADQIWSNSPEVSFIHPLGEEHGRAQVEQDVYQKLMGDTFSERALMVKDVSIHVHGDTAWSEFHWDFTAKFRNNGGPLHTRGRETQIYHKEQVRWRIVHVHYSGMPVSGEERGFSPARRSGASTG